ncbi:MAG: preprotein translocase subunit YajC [Lachnospiraceae bacterium]|nr:preprotein translocase subunit YajC [Lachnospiraceae bacterium]
MNSIILSAAGTGAGGVAAILPMIGYIAIFGVAIYFLMIRPQKKEQKRMEALLSTMAPGDSVLTTSGFYGVVIDVTDDTVIVEFGSNKNCRIPMQKSAITQVEKPEDAAAGE